MNVQVLISTMNRDDHSLLEKMNIQTDAIVINQCNKNEVEEFEFNGHHIKWFSCNEKGIGLSRNTALMRANAEVVLFADDDVVFCNNYEELILNEFDSNPKVALIVFNINCTNIERNEKQTKKNNRIRFFSSLNYGAYRFAVKREICYHNRIYFSQLYGGGSIYSAGEDNIFLNDCLKKRLRCIASKINIGTVSHETSTWYTGYSKKYFLDLGHLMYSIFGYKATMLSALLILKNRKLYKDFKTIEIMKMIRTGIIEEKRLSKK